MKLYNLSDSGELLELNQLKFNESDVYIVDDEEKETIYIWVGLGVSERKKEITADVARRFEKERSQTTKILIMKQRLEYGSFLAMMDVLQKGLIPGSTIERRPELILEKPLKIIKLIKEKEPKVKEEDAETRIKTWLEQLNKHRKVESKEMKDVPVQVEEFDLESQIRKGAYYLSLERYSYNELCWFLAEKIQRVNLGMPSLEDIRKKAVEIFNSSCSYDELCWLNAEIDILTQQKFLEKKPKRISFY